MHRHFHTSLQEKHLSGAVLTGAAQVQMLAEPFSRLDSRLLR